MWFKWHLLNIGLKIKSVFGGLKRTALDEVGNVIRKDEAGIASGDPLHYERDVASRYYEFWDKDFSNLGKMNLYFTFLVASAAVVIAKVFFTDTLMATEDYLFMSAAGIAGLCLVLFVLELLSKENDDIPVSEEEQSRAERWMHAIAEKARCHMPWWAIVIISFGLLVEAGAIAMIAASFVSDMSKNDSMIIGAVLGAIVAAGLGWLVHQAGEGLYREHHRKRLHRVINNEGGSKIDEHGKFPSDTFNTLKEDKNDFDTKGGTFLERHGKIVAAIIVIVVLAALAFVQRAELNLDMINTQQTESMDDLFYSDVSLMPTEVTSMQEEGKSKTVAEDSSHAEKGMFAALGVLTMVFLIINGVGIMLGYKYCFYDDHSEKYYKVLNKHKEQQHLRARNAEYATLARQKVLKKGNQFFSVFQRHVVKQARQESEDSLQEALNMRKAYKMEYYVEEQVKPS